VKKISVAVAFTTGENGGCTLKNFSRRTSHFLPPFPITVQTRKYEFKREIPREYPVAFPLLVAD